MATRQYLIPGKGYMNETTSNQFLIPGMLYLNSTSRAAYVFALLKQVFITIL